MRKITLIAFCLLVSVRLFASHYATAEVRYEHTGVGNVYRVHLTVVRICEPNNSVGIGTTAPVDISSSCTTTFSRSLQLSAIDSMGIFCAGLASSCIAPSSMGSGWERRVYTDTISLPPCSDWRISWNMCCRSNGILNIANAGAFSNTYVEATMNNSSSVNSSPVYCKCSISCFVCWFC